MWAECADYLSRVHLLCNVQPMSTYCAAVHPVSTERQVVTLPSVPQHRPQVVQNCTNVVAAQNVHETVENVHKCRFESGHLVNSRPSPHLTIMSFSVKIPDKLISATQSVNPTRPGRISLLAPSGSPTPANSNLIPPPPASAPSDLKVELCS